MRRCNCPKQAFPNRGAALAHNERINRRRGKSRSRRMNVYQCPDGNWHLGHSAGAVRFKNGTVYTSRRDRR